MNVQFTDAVSSLVALKSTADSIAAAADSYLDLMRDAPRVKAAVGNFYVTFNGSLVCVTRRKSPCQCSNCRQNRQQPGIIQVGPMSFQIQAPTEADPDPDHKEPDQLMVTILFGGHGNPDFAGCQPGDSYYVAVDGMVPLPAVSKDAAICSAHLGLAGLSLRRLAGVRVDHGVVAWQ